MNTLRDKVAEVIFAVARDNWNIEPMNDDDAEYLATRILAIPEIAEALRFQLAAEQRAADELEDGYL